MPVLPMEVPTKLQPVHQRDSYTFRGAQNEIQTHYVNSRGTISAQYQNYGKNLPDPPVPVSEIGPIPPPPMFSSPTPQPRSMAPPPPYTPPVSSSGIDRNNCQSK